jgi:glyoxylase-like metal-dependent hydrolase (beta-lactamase superfamily II)
MSLHYKVFQVDPKPIPSQVPGFEDAVGPATWPPSTSTLIWDDGSGALLVDCLITTSEAAALADWISGLGHAPDHVYITHPHADHLLGLPAIVAAFPNTTPVATAESIPAMQGQVSPAALEVWSGFFPGQLPDAPIVPSPLPGPDIAVGAGIAHIVPVGTTDTDLSTVVRVPELGLVVSGDVVYNNTHMWLKGSTPDSRASWLRALQTVESLGADTIIAGHRHPNAPDDDALRQIGDSRRYILDFEAALEHSTTPAELIDRMTDRYPDLANPYTLWVAAFDQLGPSSWARVERPSRLRERPAAAARNASQA